MHGTLGSWHSTLGGESYRNAGGVWELQGIVVNVFCLLMSYRYLCNTKLKLPPQKSACKEGVFV